MRHSKQIVEKALEMIEAGKPASEISKELGIPAPTVSTWKVKVRDGVPFVFDQPKQNIHEEVKDDIKFLKAKTTGQEYKKKYETLKKQHVILEEEHEAYLEIIDYSPHFNAIFRKVPR